MRQFILIFTQLTNQHETSQLNFQNDHYCLDSCNIILGTADKLPSVYAPSCLFEDMELSFLWGYNFSSRICFLEFGFNWDCKLLSNQVSKVHKLVICSLLLWGNSFSSGIYFLGFGFSWDCKFLSNRVSYTNQRHVHYSCVIARQFKDRENI